jgi:succinate dehydrogenase/fumarate reductase cytochrome b subunit
MQMEAFLRDETLKRAVTRSLSIIGEATKKIPADVKYAWKSISWREMAGMRDKLAVMTMVQRAYEEDNFSEDRQWIRHLTYEDRQLLRKVLPESDPEPDFYFMVRQLFQNPIMVLLYLITFVVLFIHMRHAFPSAFQTLGLNNYKYAKAIDILGQIYAWVVCLMFVAVVILVYLGL